MSDKPLRGSEQGASRVTVYWRRGLPYVRLPDPRLLTPRTALGALRAQVWARDERRKRSRRS